MRVLIAQMNPTIGDLTGNSRLILSALAEARHQGAELVLFPELALCGYPPEDFLLLPHFCRAVEAHLVPIIEATKGLIAVVGTIRRSTEGEKALYNSAAIISAGRLLGYHDKVLLPTYDVFSERRYFESGGSMQLWNLAGHRIAVTICEDIWQHSGVVTDTLYKRDPVAELRPLGPDLLVNLSASPYSVARASLRTALCQKVAKTLQCPVLLCNQVGGNDSLIFDGNSVYVDASGKPRASGVAFAEDLLLVDTEETSPQLAPPSSIAGAAELYCALVLGVRDYFRKSGCTRACLGLSGGIDSAIVACIAVEALEAENVMAVVMPSRFSSPETMADAHQLAKQLRMPTREISIEGPFESFLEVLKPQFAGMSWDITEENLQARIRGTILMALSNKLGSIVLSTGNKSEFAMGYSTLYGDMCGGLAVISDLTKGQVYALARYLNQDREVIPATIISRPPSAELRPHQLDSDSLPDYAIVDAVLQDYVEDHLSPEEIAARRDYPLALVLDLVKRIHRSEYKRRQAPPGLRVTQRAFSVGRRFPIVQRFIQG